ncbi:ead/Ea22-like family protein [Salmonella enterica]|nr:ead/Ea22-like family protein [Salmonella enterica]
MTALNKQALREAAQEEIILRSVSDSSDAWQDEASPEAVLALLDELEAKEEQRANWFQMAQKLGEDLDAAEKRIAELESNEIREDENQFLVVRHPGKTPVIKHCSGDLEEFLRNLIEQDPLVTIDIITHRYYGVGGQWVQDADEYLHMMAAAGIGVKGE